MLLVRAHAVPRRLARVLLCIVAVAAGACRSEGGNGKPPEPERTSADTAAAEPPVELHGVGGVEGAQPTYDQSRQPARVVAALQLAPGQRVADIGAGLGYFTPRLSEAVGPTGQVTATDIDDEVLKRLRAHVGGRKNVVVRKVAPDETGLEAGTYDLILLSEVDHFFSDRRAYLSRLRTALTPNGRVAVTHLRAMRPPLVAAATEAGYSIVSEYEGLPEHYLLFLQPTSSQ